MPKPSRLLYFALPLAVFGVLVVLFARGLDLNPKEIDSPLIGKSAPAFDLPRLHAEDRRVTNAAFEGKITLVNFFASWCVPCRSEHPLLMDLATARAVHLIGINYKDERADALAWLAGLGDPYDVIGVDADGRAAIEWGVYGVPETYIVDRAGRVRFKHAGPLTQDVFENEMRPLIAELSR